MLRSPNTKKPMKIDGHAHVFLDSLKMLENRRYTPKYNALASDYFNHLHSQNLEGGLLVQPSFLGVDNSHLLAVLAHAKKNQPNLLIKGVAVVDPSTTLADLLTLKENGITGIRLNCVSAELPNFGNPLWSSFLKNIEDLSLHVEIQLEGRFLKTVLEKLSKTNSRIIIDHFGLPDFNEKEEYSGYKVLLENSSPEVCVKVSAPYRAYPQLPLVEAVKKCTELSSQLIAIIGPERMIWGSDWPWTQHEKGQSYSDCFDWGNKWFTDQKTQAGNVPNWLMYPDD